MGPQRSVTLRGYWLGRQLRELREENGTKMSEAGEYLKRDASAVSRFETGVYPTPQQDVRQLLDLYGVNDERRRESLLRLSEAAWRTDWWDGYADEVEGWFVDYVWLESRATEFRAYDMMAVGGLFQTADYARGLIRAGNPEATDQQIDRWVDLRLMRQTILERAEPPTLSIVVDESALRRKVGGPEALSAQLRQLAARASRPNIEMRILPFDAGAHASPEGPFSIFTLDDPYPEVVFVESPGGALYLEPPKTERFSAMYDRLRTTALDPDSSVALVESIAKELE